MATTLHLPWLLLLLLLPLLVHSQPCTPLTTPTHTFTRCTRLSTLSAILHYSHDPTTSTLRLAFFATPPTPTGWVAYGLNPTATRMAGTSALVAFRGPTGTVVAKTYNVTSYRDVKEGDIEYGVEGLKAEEDGESGEVRVFAEVKLPEGTRKVNQVWQVGGRVSGGVIGVHGFAKDNLAAVGVLDLETGAAAGGGGGGDDSKIRNRNIHGILNAISWGIMLPLGAIIARYLKTFQSADPAWFYLHVSCQLIGYVVGVAGWATGIKLGGESSGIEYSAHRNIGITLFSLGTIQLFALFLRPGKEHKYRVYWNVYHYMVGYTVIILGIINVFKGLEILNPEHTWKTAYIIVIAILAGVAVLLEAITWVVVLKRKSASNGNGKDDFNRGQHLDA